MDASTGSRVRLRRPPASPAGKALESRREGVRGRRVATPPHGGWRHARWSARGSVDADLAPVWRGASAQPGGVREQYNAGRERRQRRRLATPRNDDPDAFASFGRTRAGRARRATRRGANANGGASARVRGARRHPSSPATVTTRSRRRASRRRSTSTSCPSRRRSRSRASLGRRPSRPPPSGGFAAAPATCARCSTRCTGSCRAAAQAHSVQGLQDALAPAPRLDRLLRARQRRRSRVTPQQLQDRLFQIDIAGASVDASVRERAGGLRRVAASASGGAAPARARAARAPSPFPAIVSVGASTRRWPTSYTGEHDRASRCSPPSPPRRSSLARGAATSAARARAAGAPSAAASGRRGSSTRRTRRQTPQVRLLVEDDEELERGDDHQGVEQQLRGPQQARPAEDHRRHARRTWGSSSSDRARARRASSVRRSAPACRARSARSPRCTTPGSPRRRRGARRRGSRAARA